MANYDSGTKILKQEPMSRGTLPVTPGRSMIFKVMIGEKDAPWILVTFCRGRYIGPEESFAVERSEVSAEE